MLRLGYLRLTSHRIWDWHVAEGAGRLLCVVEGGNGSPKEGLERVLRDVSRGALAGVAPRSWPWPFHLQMFYRGKFSLPTEQKR